MDPHEKKTFHTLPLDFQPVSICVHDLFFLEPLTFGHGDTVYHEWKITGGISQNCNYFKKKKK